MKIDVNNLFTVTSLAFMLIGGIYHLARMEANIVARIGLLDKKLDIHLTDYQSKHEHYEYRINDLDKRIQHQGNRLKDWIDQIVTHLSEKSGFMIRDRKL
ncbi:hypothetical protein [Nostoc sp. PCC 7107]|uniref:hypothetical protein n=1 Tax=Nostoc sp. PCC 7107 TaxID=317936 RepID=UPI00029F2AE2|nr:hypothetical protein [Nostoc sp. PCC 7107]AFY43761.1 hypothetical protein Nos7107_3171 [Nostoc sp. PCC 7107]